MPKVRAYGADATLKACREAVYGVAPPGPYRSLDFKSTDLSSAQPLGDDPLLGRGRNAQDPYRSLVTDEGQIEIPLDLRGTGFWLTGLFGDPVTTAGKAAGSIAFATNPSAGDTITLNGTIWTFVSGPPSGNETEIQATVTQTVDQLVADLAASADPEVSKCSYARPSGTQTLAIEFDTAGPSGNGFTLAASSASVSGLTLTGGGYGHLWESGADDIPSYTVEIGHPKLATPVFFRHAGTVMESIELEMGQEGPANARLQLVAQGEERAAATLDAAPETFTLRRFSQGRGFIRRGGSALAGVTGGSLTFSNTLERVRTIRGDGRIEAADPTLAAAQGALTLRFDGATLVAEAADGDPVALEYGFTFPEGYTLRFELPRVFLPKPKYAVSGPGGVEASFDWRAAFDDAEGTMLRAHLLNDVTTYV
ncbi:phage tail tube protein [Albidovulum sp.]